MYSQQSYQTRHLGSVPFSQPPSHPPYRSPHHAGAYPYSTKSLSSKNHRPPTPPEDMDSVHVPSAYHPGVSQELGRFYGDKNPNQYGGYQSYDVASQRPSQQSYAAQHAPISRQSSPTTSQQSYTSNTTQPSRTASVTSMIAPSLQIPRTINNSQGSLAELAAQITCLFWFESSSTLEFAEDSRSQSMPVSSLNLETIPTTGFRKFVTTLLSTTQVAQNVVLLALLFIYRLKKQNPSVKGKLGSEYRLLTVALMLGNKFLDDNTYTNKTWADVTGISVAEVHIMEVEFLSNMKYNLFTTTAQWAGWQTQLGRFAHFLERAALHQSQTSFPSTQTQQGFTSNTLPSPPNSYQASPPRPITPIGATQPTLPLPPFNPALARPASMGPAIQSNGNKRKRSLEDDELLTTAKRMMQPHMMQSQSYNPSPVNADPSKRPESLPYPHLNSVSQGSSQGSVGARPVPSYRPLSLSQMPQQLPPLSQQFGPGPIPWQHTPASQGPSMGSMAAALRSAQASRTQSPYLSSTNVSPTNTSLLPASVTPQTHQSPTFFLRQRDSPYKPVRGVHTLLVPPPVRALHQPEHVGNNQMHYQPLGRPAERQTGRLPYIHQNQWYDPTQQRHGRPVDQWGGSTFPGPRLPHQLPAPQHY